jgi:inner membrane protein
MDLITNLYTTDPFWVWLAIAAVILGLEVATGSGYLMWPAGAAAIIAVINLTGIRMGLPAELALVAVLTLVATLTTKRWMPKNIHGDNPDINDPSIRLVGRRGVATANFVDGRGRVDVDGKDWAAELDAGEILAAGTRVEVIGIIDGARLSVRAA